MEREEHRTVRFSRSGVAKGSWLMEREEYRTVRFSRGGVATALAPPISAAGASIPSSSILACNVAA